MKNKTKENKKPFNCTIQINKKQSLINYLLIKKIKPIWRHKSSDILTYTERRNGVKLKKNIIFDNDDFEWNKLRIRERFNLSYYQLENRLVKINRQRNHNLLMIKQQQNKKIREFKKQRSSTNFKDYFNKSATYGRIPKCRERFTATATNFWYFNERDRNWILSDISYRSSSQNVYTLLNQIFVNMANLYLYII